MPTHVETFRVSIFDREEEASNEPQWRFRSRSKMAGELIYDHRRPTGKRGMWCQITGTLDSEYINLLYSPDKIGLLNARRVANESHSQDVYVQKPFSSIVPEATDVVYSRPFTSAALPGKDEKYVRVDAEVSVMHYRGRFKRILVRIPTTPLRCLLTDTLLHTYHQSLSIKSEDVDQDDVDRGDAPAMLLVGTLSTGVRAIGPFTSMDAAHAWAEGFVVEEGWTAMPLFDPDDLEDEGTD